MIYVTHMKQTPNCERVCRPSILGNPYSHKFQSSNKKIHKRDDAIAEYRQWLNDRIRNNDIIIIKELERLLEIAKQGDLYLGCWCSPKSCHGDVIKEVLEKALITGIIMEV